MTDAATPQGDPERRLAHERLSTGGLARWMRALEDRGILLVPVSAAFRRGAAR